MSDRTTLGDAGLEPRAAALRHAFDRSFALPSGEAPEEIVDLLTIRVAGVAYAVRLREIAGVVARHVVTPVPTAAAHLLGVAGVRGAIVPVFGLASILGHGAARTSPGWLLLCRTEELVGLGFSELDGYVRAPQSSFHAAGAGPEDVVEHKRSREVVRTGAGALPLIGIPAVLANLGNRARQSTRAEEQ